MPLHPKGPSTTNIKKSPGLINVKKAKKGGDGGNKEETGGEKLGKRKQSTISISDSGKFHTQKQGNKEKIHASDGKRQNSAEYEQQQHTTTADPGPVGPPATGPGPSPGKKDGAAVASASKKWKSMVGKPGTKHLGKRKSGISVRSNLKKSRSKSAISVLDHQHRHSHQHQHPRTSADDDDDNDGIPQEESKDETASKPPEEGQGVVSNPTTDVEEVEAKKPLASGVRRGEKSRAAVRKPPKKNKGHKKKKSRLRPCCCGQFQFRSCCILMVVAHILVWFFVWIFYLLAQSETYENIDATINLSFVGIILIGVNSGMSLIGAFLLTVGILCRKRIPCLMHFGIAILNSVFTLVLAVVVGLVLQKKTAECISLSLFCAFSAIVFAYAAYCSFGLAKLIIEGKDKVDEVEPTYIDDSPTDEEDFLPAYVKNY